MSETGLATQNNVTVENVNCFDILKVSVLFESSLLQDNDVQMDAYLAAYEEIMKFFQLMGSVFSFVSSDVRSKIDILYALRATDTEEQQHFNSIRTMLEYEKEAQLLNQKGYVSGSRTLLRLHRGLEFVYEFLNRIQAIPDDEKTVEVCKAAYDDTLGKHHSFLIRKGARLAMYAMPTRGDLLKKVCSNVEVAKENLPTMLDHMRTNYDRTEQLYTLHDLHSLP
ncbi:ceramide-1-phosphate transfer protein [Drosophila rhopaloa]|uniref:Glycolipid transfer protein domain-containing protein n=2 Tax=Drosophila rhopaloa TaxID=1041015 RepID=A0ABM5I644_DRORH|nr:ceramide-1-phosphate transfer protein [Drosophila rhopaloa]